MIFDRQPVNPVWDRSDGLLLSATGMAVLWIHTLWSAVPRSGCRAAGGGISEWRLRKESGKTRSQETPLPGNQSHMPSSPWQIPLYRHLWYNTVVIALANQCERLAVGWLVLSETDSVFLTAASFAINKAPASIAGPIAGHLSDRIPREKMLAATVFFKSGVVLSMAAVAFWAPENVWPIFLLMALSGAGMSFETPATQGLITDIVPRELAWQCIPQEHEPSALWAAWTAEF